MSVPIRSRKRRLADLSDDDQETVLTLGEKLVDLLDRDADNSTVSKSSNSTGGKEMPSSEFIKRDAGNVIERIAKRIGDEEGIPLHEAYRKALVEDEMGARYYAAHEAAAAHQDAQVVKAREPGELYGIAATQAAETRVMEDIAKRAFPGKSTPAAVAAWLGTEAGAAWYNDNYGVSQ